MLRDYHLRVAAESYAEKIKYKIEMRKIILIFLFLTNICFGQNIKPSDDEAIINLSISDLEGKPLKSKIFFKSSNKDYSFQTDIKGLATIIVQVGQNYIIKIPNSDTYFDYEIVNFPGQILNLPLKFNIGKNRNIQNVATEDNALLILSTFNLPKDKEIEIIDEKTKLTYAITKQDTFKIAVPNGNNYRIKIKGYTIKNDIVIIDKTPQNIMYYVLYINNSNSGTLLKSQNEAFFNIVYTNIFTKLPVSDEIVVLESMKGKKKYEGKTSQNGTYLFVVPLDDTYSVNISHAKNVIKTKVEKKETIYLYDCKLLFPSTKELVEQKKDDSIRLAKRDIEYKKLSTTEIIDDKNRLKADINAVVEHIKVKIKDDSTYFQKTKNVVCAVLYRLQKKWNSKMIVTDLTGSMYPYMRQLLLWHSLKMMTNENNDYVFFNDGDNKPDYSKVIGKTGGIYYTDNDNTDVIIEKMFETIRNGNGGDGPENDLEALIYAQSMKKSFSELILIADNYAPVKDLSLLEQLNVPVRIILCGTDWGVNPDYIEIAYKTKGSIHTIEQDIMSLGDLVDGNTIKIGNQTYIYSKGKFFKQK